MRSLAIAAALLMPAAALAQTVPEPQREAKQPEAPPQETVVPPRLLEAAQADYPASQLAERKPARVVLEIDVDEAGAVSTARVVSPPQPDFDASALAAAKRLKFAPASQGGKAIP